ncbi:MAG: cytochrome c family protein [Hyphomicrobiaceae bacterium]
MWTLGLEVRVHLLVLLLLSGLSAMLDPTAEAIAASDPSAIVGPNACAECHKQEVEAWKGSHHFKTFREMPRDKLGKKIAERLGIRRIKSESLCLTCHFTVQQRAGGDEPIAGISCESCHSGGKDWIKVHSDYSGKKADTETKAETSARWKRAESKGMIRPSSLYRLAKNCFGCHLVPQERLVNIGGHRSGSAFDLVAWSQGEVRHNTWHSKGKDNVPADAKRRRMLYVVGLGVELETALRAVGKASVRDVFAFDMAFRADRIRKKLSAAAKAVPEIPEIAEISKLGHSAGLKLKNESELSAAADSIAGLVQKIAANYDGSSMAGLDSLIPGPDSFKGKARKPSGTD